MKRTKLLGKTQLPGLPAVEATESLLLWFIYDHSRSFLGLVVDQKDKDVLKHIIMFIP